MSQIQSMSKSRSVVWAVWAIASIFYAYQYILRVMPNIMLYDIMEKFDISAAAFGQFSGVYYIGYSLMHLPLGLMLDRFGPRKVMSGCVLLTLTGLLPLLFADYWVWPIAGRFLIGAGSSAAILGVFKIVRMMFREERFARMLSLSVMIGLIGAIYGGGPVSWLREQLGFEAVVQLTAVAGVVLAFATWWIVPDLQSVSENTMLGDIKEVLRNPRVLVSCMCAGLMVGPLEGFADVWGTAFLKQVYGFEGTLAASLPSMIFIGMCFGSPVLSYIADKIGSYLAAILCSGVLMAACFFALLNGQLPPTLLSINFVLVGVCCSYQILAIYKASTYVREQVAGLATAVANMIIMTFGYLFHAAMGSVINAMGGASDSQALVYGVYLIPIGLCLGAGGFLFLLVFEKKLAAV
jgi:predicted MFS family arabinose efflux permease